MTTRKLSTPFATNSTLINQVPVSQTSDSQASYDIGFPPKNFQTIANGGVAVDGKDFNGLLNDITGNIVDLNKGLPQYYDDAYATLIGGYPVGARLCLNDNSDYVISTIANNTNNPNTNMTGWIRSKYFNSVAEMSAIAGSGIAITKSYYLNSGKGGATYFYDSTQANVNNGVTIINGWCLDNYTDIDTIDCFVAGFKADGTDEAALATKVFKTLDLQVHIPNEIVIAIDAQSGLEYYWACGEGTIKWLNFDPKTDMERVVNSNVFPNPYRHGKSFIAQQNAEVKGALGGRNVGRRFECNPTKKNNYTFDSMKTLIDYGGADVIADMVAITDKPVNTYSGCTYTATTVQSDGLKGNIDIETGDYIRAGNNLLGVVSSIDTTTGTITLVDGWGNTDTKELNVTPTNDMVCKTPIAYRIWGRNDYVTVLADYSEVYNIIGYELDIIAGHNLQDICGFFSVAFGTDTCVAGFRTGRGTQKWWYGLHCPANTVNAGLYVELGATYGIQHGAQYTTNSITVYSSQAYKGVKVTYARESGIDVDNTPTAVLATNVSVGLRIDGGSDTGMLFNATNDGATALKNTTNKGYLLNSEVAGYGNFTVSSMGSTNRTRKVINTVTADALLSRDNVQNMIIVAGSTANLQLSTSFESGEVLEIKSTRNADTFIKDQGGTTIATLNSTAKSYGRFLLNNGSWITLFTA